MLGFSVYLNHDLTNNQINLIENMQQSGFKGIFTSLHIPEDDEQAYLPRLKELGGLCKKLKLSLTADISADGLKKMGIELDDIQQLAEIGLTALRVDDGVLMSDVAKLSRQIPIALNASTISAEDVDELHRCHANFKQLEAWHNYYPRPETGLDDDWLKAKNQWLKTQGFTTMAFVAGDEDLRGPIYAGLPTLESDRSEHPLAATLKLINHLAVDKVYIGDAGLSKRVRSQFEAYFNGNTVQLTVQSSNEALFESDWHNRPDVARDVVRLVEGRQRFTAVSPLQTVSRPRGAITIDNERYGRYVGEFEIVKKTLAADPRVNVVGWVVPSDLALLPWIGSNCPIRFIKKG